MAKIVTKSYRTEIELDSFDECKHEPIGVIVYERKSSARSSKYAMLTKITKHEYGFVDMLSRDIMPCYRSCSKKEAIELAIKAKREVNIFEDIDEFSNWKSQKEMDLQ